MTSPLSFCFSIGPQSSATNQFRGLLQMRFLDLSILLTPVLFSGKWTRSHSVVNSCV